MPHLRPSTVKGFFRAILDQTDPRRRPGRPWALARSARLDRPAARARSARPALVGGLGSGRPAAGVVHRQRRRTSRGAGPFTPGLRDASSRSAAPRLGVGDRAATSTASHPVRGLEGGEGGRPGRGPRAEPLLCRCGRHGQAQRRASPGAHPAGHGRGASDATPGAGGSRCLSRAAHRHGRLAGARPGCLAGLCGAPAVAGPCPASTSPTTWASAASRCWRRTTGCCGRCGRRTVLRSHLPTERDNDYPLRW